MDEQRQPDGNPEHAEVAAWRVNGAHSAAGVAGVAGSFDASRAADDGSAIGAPEGAALEVEPLALLAPGSTGGEARHRQPSGSGLDDETPPGGLPTMEPPLWREAIRYIPSGSYPDYRSPHPPAPAGEPVTEEPAEPPVVTEPAVAAVAEPEPVTLPQRVPAEPDVPVSTDYLDPADQPASGSAAGRERWTAPELAWIADQLRRDDVPGEVPAEPFDVDAVVAAVREVGGVESASVRPSPTGMHTLRLDLADDADPGQVSRTVARLLLERMGLSTAPQHVPQPRQPESAAVPRPRQPEPAPTPRWTPPTDRGTPPTQSPQQWSAPQLEPHAPPDLRESDPLGGRPPADGSTVAGYPLGEEPWPPVDSASEKEPEPVSRPLYTGRPGLRVLIDRVKVSTFGLEATVEVQLTAGARQAIGVASGPSVDSYLIRLAAVAAGQAIDQLLREVAEPEEPSRCFVEHTGVMAFGNTEVAVAVVLLVCGGWVEQLTGSALVDGDPRQAVVRATLGAVNRRLEALLS